ncbi:hypothetical protein B296_00032557 [Ensete ventricosum]|uniref:Uncharacterized protein n=1 Tax=Ensete ventricosum TaxID=4639 RepID=A0A426YST3_ENSVE|nr:hypothetical protein B296_00032557 [Ensete ventricosum]
MTSNPHRIRLHVTPPSVGHVTAPCCKTIALSSLSICRPSLGNAQRVSPSSSSPLSVASPWLLVLATATILNRTCNNKGYPSIATLNLLFLAGIDLLKPLPMSPSRCPAASTTPAAISKHTSSSPPLLPLLHVAAVAIPCYSHRHCYLLLQSLSHTIAFVIPCCRYYSLL